MYKTNGLCQISSLWKQGDNAPGTAIIPAHPNGQQTKAGGLAREQIERPHSQILCKSRACNAVLFLKPSRRAAGQLAKVRQIEMFLLVFYSDWSFLFQGQCMASTFL